MSAFLNIASVRRFLDWLFGARPPSAPAQAADTDLFVVPMLFAARSEPAGDALPPSAPLQPAGAHDEARSEAQPAPPAHVWHFAERLNAVAACNVPKARKGLRSRSVASYRAPVPGVSMPSLKTSARHAGMPTPAASKVRGGQTAVRTSNVVTLARAPRRSHDRGFATVALAA